MRDDQPLLRCEYDILVESLARQSHNAVTKSGVVITTLSQMEGKEGMAQPFCPPLSQVQAAWSSYKTIKGIYSDPFYATTTVTLGKIAKVLGVPTGEIIEEVPEEAEE